MNNFFGVKSLPLAACAVFTGVCMPVLAETVDLTVIGTILPAACTPSLSGGGAIDYSSIDPSTLSPTALTPLAEKVLTLTIACDAQVKVALRAVNGRINTAAGVTTPGTNSDGLTPVTLFGAAATGVVGLGLDGTVKIGGYAIRVTPGTVVADSNSVDSLRTTDIASAWTNDAQAGDLYDPATTRLISWGATGTTTPVGITNLTGELSVQAYLNNVTELNLSHQIVLDGLTTIELVYL